MKIRMADYVFRYLADYGIRHVFLVVGGGAMHLNDALNKEKRIQFVCVHHEQAAAIAAEGYSRAGGGLGVVSVTSGPGGTNALTGVIGQWLDSVPVLYLSGQVKFETTIASVPELGLRQLGDQEINIVDIVRPVTKYARMITDPESIKAELPKAIGLALSGRPGPVWLDIPLNVQGALIDDERPAEAVAGVPTPQEPGDEALREVILRLKAAKRPVLAAGHGIRISRGEKLFLDLVRSLDIPVVTTFNGFDLIASDSSHFIGRIGTLGSRAGNFALQNADLVLCLGTRNNIRQVSYNWDSFAKRAVKILVDADAAELHKPTVKGDVLVHCDARLFMERLLAAIPEGFRADPAWLRWCLERKSRYPVVLNEYRAPDKRRVHPYFFVEQLTSALGSDAVVAAGNGSACVVLFQAGIVKAGQRVFWNSGCASMGYDLPAAVGAAFALGRDVVCLAGDGSLQMNIQELQTISARRLPVKIFLLNNEGYRSIEQTQTAFFGGDFIGCNAKSGVSFPDFKKVARAYGLKYRRIGSTASMRRTIREVLSTPGPVACEVVLDNAYNFSPKLSSERMPDGRMVSKPLEDLHPFLEREEFLSNIVAEAREGSDA
jgi:acetolactate synthase-1/2/3 large subunit